MNATEDWMPPALKNDGCAQVIKYVTKTIDDYLRPDSEMSADDALCNIATMIEVRGLHIFKDMPRLPPP
jgi:hypothetical protein